MQGMWNQLVTILDFLRARENILIDNSWLHTPESIEMIVQNFGANRILFGMGFKSHNGASIAALLHAEINEEARECIAHKNLDELLGIQDIKMDCEIPVSSPNGKNSLWNRFINDQNIEVDIIDAHGHLGASSINVIKQNTVKKQVEYLSPLMEKINIKTLIVSSMQALNGDGVEGNITLEKDMASCNNGNYLGYLSFNPFYGSKLASLFDEFFSRNFYIGFKLLCDYWAVPVTDSRFKPVWEYADGHHMPILLHTWEGNYDSPALLKDIAAEYSNAIFILGHSGGGDKGRREAIELAIREAREGDVVIIAGKGHEDYQIIGKQVHHFSDREVAAEMILKAGKGPA
jgi:predicted TIM-barrel fold metal-dependent hydrolase